MIKRYDLGVHDEIEEAPEGIFVRHAAYKARCNQLETALRAMLDHVKDRTLKEGCLVCDEARSALTNDAGDGT